MKTVRDVMTAEVIRLSPTNKIKTALILMKGHNIGGLPVVEEDRVVGLLDYQDVLGKDTDISVQNVMDREFVTIPPGMPVVDAADLMAKINSSRLLVFEDGRLAGVVTRGDLMPELGKSVDPITGLFRADAMRDWGISALKRGVEITVIFIDLDDFGHFNKKYGHIIGDKVLQHVADVLKSHVDGDRDMLCRYAGDEFVIVTTRDVEDAQALADLVHERIASTPSDLPEPVTGAVGVRGGKRTKEREDVHYNATLDNLINLASKACILAKGHEESAPDGAGLAEPVQLPVIEPEPTIPPGGRLKIQGLNFSWTDSSQATAEVILAGGGTACKESQSGFALGGNALRLVADATARAASQFLPGSGYGVVVETVNVVSTGTDDAVLVTALFVTPKVQVRVSGSALVKQDAYRAVAAALLDAVNRQIATL
ncbi:MAG: CBS domain-containing protein [Armatimonadota bacterium]